MPFHSDNIGSNAVGDAKPFRFGLLEDYVDEPLFGYLFPEPGLSKAKAVNIS